MADVGFIRPAHRRIIIDADTIHDLLGAMAAFTPITNVLQIDADDL
jgi:hypothetical protein